MPCCHPFQAFDTGNLTENGKKDYIICSHFTTQMLDVQRANKPVNLAKAPFKKVNGRLFLVDPVQVPCGKCVGCRMSKAKDWKIRNCLELQEHKEAWFVTLTYDNGHVPFNENGELTLVKRDLQLFFKRLRKYIGPFRYFACGEYGTSEHGTRRPHFHMILYGHLEGFRLQGPNRFICDTISQAWDKGLHLVETVTPGSVAYVCGYVEKKQLDPNWYEYPVKPFVLMSRRPGIGMTYIEKHMDSIKSTQKVYGLFNDGMKGSEYVLPRGFKNKLSGELWYEEAKAAAQEAGETLRETMRHVYRMMDDPSLNDIMEQAAERRLANMRKVSL